MYVTSRLCPLSVKETQFCCLFAYLFYYCLKGHIEINTLKVDPLFPSDVRFKIYCLLLSKIIQHIKQDEEMTNQALETDSPDLNLPLSLSYSSEAMRA